MPILLAGVERDVPGVTVRTWKDPGGFTLYGHPACFLPMKDKRRAVSMGVLHATVTGSVEATWKVLVLRSLSVHFCLAADGTLFQFLDTNEVAYHASGVNQFSWGVEIVNPWDIAHQDVPERPHVPVGVTATGNPKKMVLGYTAAQQKAVLALAEAIHAHYGIPKQLPAPVTDKRVEPTAAGVSAGYEERVRQGKMACLSGHYHSSPPTPSVHVDPGVALWHDFRNSDWAVA